MTVYFDGTQYSGFLEFLDHVATLVESGTITCVSRSTTEFIPKNDLFSYLFTSEIDEFFRVAIEANRIKSINLMLDYYNVPSGNMTVKERLSYYQLLHANDI